MTLWAAQALRLLIFSRPLLTVRLGVHVPICRHWGPHPSLLELLRPGKVTPVRWRAVRYPVQVSSWALPTQAQIIQATKVTCQSLLETCMCGLCPYWEEVVQGAGNDRTGGSPGCKLLVR